MEEYIFLAQAKLYQVSDVVSFCIYIFIFNQVTTTIFRQSFAHFSGGGVVKNTYVENQQQYHASSYY